MSGDILLKPDIIMYFFPGIWSRIVDSKVLHDEYKRTVESPLRDSCVCSTAVVRTPRFSLSPLDPRKGRTEHRGSTVMERN